MFNQYGIETHDPDKVAETYNTDTPGVVVEVRDGGYVVVEVDSETGWTMQVEQDSLL